MKHILIVVTDATLARFFTFDSISESLIEINSMAHPEGRMHDCDMTSDLPGKGSGGSAGKHSYEGKTDPKKHEQGEFAKQIAVYVDDAQNSDQLSKLLLVASPALLGELRSHLSAESLKKLVFELDKNLTHQSIEDIQKHLPKSIIH